MPCWSLQKSVQQFLLKPLKVWPQIFVARKVTQHLCTHSYCKEGQILAKAVPAWHVIWYIRKIVFNLTCDDTGNLGSWVEGINPLKPCSPWNEVDLRAIHTNNIVLGVDGPYISNCRYIVFEFRNTDSKLIFTHIYRTWHLTR